MIIVSYPTTDNPKGKNPSSQKTPNESGLLQTIQRILQTPLLPLERSPMIFKFSQEAALENALTLSSFDFSIKSMINSKKFTSLHSGCEFRTIKSIRPILQLHHNGAEVEKYLLSGVNYDLDPDKVYTESDRKRDLEEAIETEINNQSALKQSGFV